MSSGVNTVPLLKDAVAAMNGAIRTLENNNGSGFTVQAKVSGSGAVTAAVSIYGSHYEDNTSGVLLASLSPADTNNAFDHASFNAPWKYIWAVLDSVSGTNAKVNVTVGM